MIRVNNKTTGETHTTEYRLGELELALDNIQKAGMKIVGTEIDLDNKSLDITVKVKEVTR